LPPKCLVPNVLGKTLAVGKARIKAGHCRIGKITFRKTVARQRGRVLAESPRPGKRLANGAKVNLIVGRGR
jgi:beta-lactam-binding protein with PASTA domain